MESKIRDLIKETSVLIENAYHRDLEIVSDFIGEENLGIFDDIKVQDRTVTQKAVLRRAGLIQSLDEGCTAARRLNIFGAYYYIAISSTNPGFVINSLLLILKENGYLKNTDFDFTHEDIYARYGARLSA